MAEYGMTEAQLARAVEQGWMSLEQAEGMRLYGRVAPPGQEEGAALHIPGITPAIDELRKPAEPEATGPVALAGAQTGGAQRQAGTGAETAGAVDTSGPANAAVDALMGTAQQLKGFAYRGVSDDVKEGIQGALDQQAEAAVNISNVQQWAAEDTAKLQGEVIGQLAASETSMQALVGAQQEAREKAMQKLEIARTNQLYARAGEFGLTAEAINRAKEVLEDPEAMPGARRWAETVMQKAQKASEVNPQRLLGSAGNRIMAALAMAMGAFGSALTKTPNYAMQIIHKAIDDDIASQREKFNRAGKAYSAERSDYMLMVEQFRDQRQAETALKINRLEKAGALAKQIEAKRKTAELPMQQELMSAKIELEKQKELAKLEQQEINTAMQALGKAGQMQYYAGTLTQRAAGSKSKPWEQGGVPYGTSWTDKAKSEGRVLSKKQYENIGKSLGGKAKLQGLLQMLHKERAKAGGGEFWNRYTRHQLKNIRSHLVDATRSAYNWGARFEATEEKLLEARFPPSGAEFFQFVQKQLEAEMATVKRENDAMLINEGLIFTGYGDQNPLKEYEYYLNNPAASVEDIGGKAVPKKK